MFGINNNLNEIDKYVLEIDKAQKLNRFCIRHKIDLFGFNLKQK